MPFIFLAQLAIAAVFFVVGELLRPKPEYEDAEAVPYEEANIPSTDTGKKQAVIWGKVDLRSPHVMDFPFYTQIPIKEKVKTGLFSSTKVTTGFRYVIGLQLGICKSFDTLHKIWVDDRSLPFSSVDNGDNGIRLTINQPSFLGGPEAGGGLVGTVTVYKGTPTQNPNSYLGAFRSNNPAYRWTAYAVLNSFEIGESPNISNWGFQVSRYPDPLGLGANNIIGDDLNPMSLVYEVLTDNDYGFALSASDIDASTFIAAGNVLKTEANGVSLKWVNNQSIDRLIDTINRQVEGVLRYNPFSGKWEYKLVRNDYVVGNLPVLDETNVLKLTSYARASWDETVNVMEIQYNQRDSQNKPPPAMADDQSNFIRQGRQKVQQLNFPACYSKDTAQAIAAREMKTYGFPLATIEITVDREGFDLLPGDAFVFSWNQLGITQLVFRVGDIGFGTEDQLELNISGIEDIFSPATAVFTAPPVSGWTSVVLDPVAITVFRLDDTPYIIAKDDPNQNPITLKDTLMSLVETPQGNGISFNLFTRQGTDAFTLKGAGKYLPSGTLQSALDEDTVDTVASVVITGVSNAPAIDTVSRNDTEIQQEFQNLALIVSTVDDPFEQLGSGAKYLAEWVAYEGASIIGNTVTLTNVHRGMLDSLPADHNAGDRVWFITGAGIDGPALSATLLDGTTAETEDAQLQNVATTGESTNTSTNTFTSRNRVNLPYPGAGFTLNGSRYPSSPVGLGGDILAAWFHRNRPANVILYQSDSVDQEASTGVPQTGFEYILDIYDDTGTAGNPHLRRVLATGSSIGAGGAAATDTFDDSSNSSFDYTNTLQTTDGGPYDRYRFELRVTNSAETIVNIIDVIRLIDVTTS